MIAADESDAKQRWASLRTAIVVSLAVGAILLLAFLAGIFLVPILQTRMFLQDTYPDYIDRSQDHPAIARLGGRKRAVVQLRAYLRAPDWLAPEKDRACGLLILCGEAAVDGLIHDVTSRSTSARVRMATMFVLGHVRPVRQDVVPALTDLLEDADPGVRRCAAQALGDIGSQAKDAEIIIREALEDEALGVQVAAAFALWRFTGETEKTVPVLVRGLCDEDPVVRRSAAFNLFHMRVAPPAAVSALKKALRDQDVEIRLVAYGMLANIGPAAKGAVPALEKALASEKDPEVCASVAQALRRIRGWAYPEEKPKDEGSPDAAPEAERDAAPKTPAPATPKGVEEPGQDAP